MDPNRYLEGKGRKAAEIRRNEPPEAAPVHPVKNAPSAERKPVTASASPPVVTRAAEPVPKPIRRSASRPVPTGRLCVSGKRFFGQILIDHWVIRINGEQKKLPFGKNKMSIDLPAGMYLVTAYTPYLGIHCMRVTADIEIRPGAVTNISYQTVFDIFKNGVIRQNHASLMQ